MLMILRKLTLKTAPSFQMEQWRCDVIIAHHLQRSLVVCCSGVTGEPEKACCVGNSEYVCAYHGI